MNGFAHNLEQMVVYAIVRCQHFASTEIGIATAEVCHAASRLSNDKASGSHIPWSEESLDAPLGTPCRYIAQLYGCRAQQAFGTYRAIHLLYGFENNGAESLTVVGKPEQYLCAVHRINIGHMDRGSIHNSFDTTYVGLPSTI